MSVFREGDEVVCVLQPRTTRYGEVLPQKGHHYTIRECLFIGEPRVLLNEVANALHNYQEGRMEPCWVARAFRPVRRETIEIFKQMCVSTKPLVDIESAPPALQRRAPGDGAGRLDPARIAPSPTSYGTDHPQVGPARAALPVQAQPAVGTPEGRPFIREGG